MKITNRAYQKYLRSIPCGKYKMQKGDTLWGLAKTVGISLAALRKLNPRIKDPKQIQIGQTVNLPKNICYKPGRPATNQSPWGTTGTLLIKKK